MFLFSLSYANKHFTQIYTIPQANRVTLLFSGDHPWGRMVVGSLHETTMVVLYGRGAYSNPTPRLQGVVLAPVIISVEELLEPLQKFKVVLKTALDQFVNGNNL